MEGEIRTDLALEVQERFTEDDVEVKGVVLKEDFCEDGRMRVTRVEILNEHGAEVMKKPLEHILQWRRRNYFPAGRTGAGR